MYTIIVYDVDQNRNRHVLGYLRTYLNWVQNSVFEGELTKAQLREVKEHLKSVQKAEDSILVYELDSPKYLTKEVIGTEKGSTSNII